MIHKQQTKHRTARDAGRNSTNRYNMNQVFLDTAEDCDWLREIHLTARNLNNANPIPDFKSACIMGNEDCPQKIILYASASPLINDPFAEAFLMDSGRYSFIKH